VKRKLSVKKVTHATTGDPADLRHDRQWQIMLLEGLFAARKRIAPHAQPPSMVVEVMVIFPEPETVKQILAPAIRMIEPHV
jgi:hypothetical protein